MLAGFVCLVGAGPGDSGLITRQGLAYLKRAEVILYDQLVPVELLLEAPSGCELINVGKACGKPSFPQEAINELLIAKARSKFVVRLKGGDPFLFGRGGEEVRALVAARVPYFVVPGISAALSVPASAGIPVTDRQFAPGLVIGTGHRADEAAPDLPYTQVILMSLTTLAEVAGQLIAQGYPEDTPAAVISRGTTPLQQRVAATLANIGTAAARQKLEPPALLVVGEVVKLADTMDWRQYLPLNGKRLLWTRPFSGGDQEFLEELRLLGAQVIHFPVFEIQPFPPELVGTMLPEIGESEWIVFTSQRAVEILFESMIEGGLDWRYFAKCRFAVVGAKTATALRRRGRCPDLVATAANSVALGADLLKVLQPGERVALCRAETTLPHLANALTEARISYRDFKLYRMACPVYPRDIVAKVFAEPFAAVVFTAPMAVEFYFQILNAHGLKSRESSRYACLGNETATELIKAGRQPWLVPDRPYLEDLISAIIEQWGGVNGVSRYQTAPVAPKPAVTQTIG